jgi:DNA-binding CsgD family transcriptional regulator
MGVPTKRAEIHKLVHEGLSNKEIVERLGVDPKAAQSVRSYINYEAKKKKLAQALAPEPRGYRADIKALIAQGLKNREIADKLGCKLKSVQNARASMRAVGKVPALPPLHVANKPKAKKLTPTMPTRPHTIEYVDSPMQNHSAQMAVVFGNADMVAKLLKAMQG